MSDLTTLEKRKLEQFLGMSSGYVLDFSNRTFAEIIKDSSGQDIFSSRYDYGTGSKANRLRRFWQLETNAVVAKLLSEIIEDAGEKPSAPGLQEVCRLIVNRLKGSPIPSPAAASSPKGPSAREISKELAVLKQDFLALAVDNDRNRAGLRLEGVLNRLFDVNRLKPRQPFRVVGEQIDGSFELDSEIYLVESKWEKDPLSAGPLYIFQAKIENKSNFTRGVFIAINGVTKDALTAITTGKTASFFLMTGHDLLAILEGAMSLPDFLRQRVRLLAEQGLVYTPFSELSI
jgi:hypothetical protein